MVGEIILNVFLLLIGFVLLVKGADFFVDGASGIAKKLKISTFIIGATVVALGTSAPELAVTVASAVSGSGELIVGNILGSNVINIFLILGLSAVICKLPVEKSAKIIDLPFLIVTSGVFVLLGAFDSVFTWWEGLILLALYVLFMVYNVLLAKKQSKVLLEEAPAVAVTFAETEAVCLTRWQKIKAGYEKLLEKVWFLIVLTIVGLAMIVGGAQLVVNSAQFIARDVLKISPEIIALTVVAFGTSLPELVTSVSAARKGDVGIATGNVIGSNIANVLLIGGVGALCSGGTGLYFSTEGIVSGVVALFAAIVLLISSWTKTGSVTRIAGIILLGCFIAYYAFLFLNLYVFKLY